MDQHTKMALGIGALMVALLMSVNAIVLDNGGTNMFGWAIFFFLVAFGFWYWLRRDATAADQAAEEAMRAAEDELNRLEASSQAMLQEAPAVAEPTMEVAETLEEASQEVVETLEQATEAVADVVEEAPEAAQEIVEAAAEEVRETVQETIAEVAEMTTEAAEVVEEDDDLTRIEGIGPSYRDKLIAAGINTFAELAALDGEQIEALVKEQGGRRSASMATWAEQAKLAAAGDWEALDALQEALTGGRRD